LIVETTHFTIFVGNLRDVNGFSWRDSMAN